MQLCSKYTDQPAIASYVWPWGETGFCGVQYQIELNQIAGNLSRSVSFLPLANAPEIPMERSERTKLKAELLVCEEELQEAKKRAVDWYTDNVKLSAQVQAYAMRQRELEAQIQDAQITITRLEQRLVIRDSEQGSMVEELDRLRTIAQYVDQATKPSQ